MIKHVAQSRDFAELKTRVAGLHGEFERRYSNAVQMAVDKGGKAAPTSPAAQSRQAAAKHEKPAAPAEHEKQSIRDEIAANRKLLDAERSAMPARAAGKSKSAELGA